MKKIYIYTLSTLLLWGAASCKRLNDFGTTNVNPAATTTPIPSALLANVMAGLGGFATTNGITIAGAQYAQLFSETQYPSVSLYDLQQDDFSQTYYLTALYDLQTVINLNQDKTGVAVAKILQQYIYWNLTDAWGDLPYSQALQGIKNISPAYDTQETIYKGILSTLESAQADLSSGSVAGDIIYNGSAASWQKMANSLRMLVALQLSAKVSGASDYAATAFKSAMAAGYITTNAQNFTQVYTTTYKNPWYNLYLGRTDFAESKTVTDLTASLSDGRTVPFGGNFLDPQQITGGTETSNIGLPPGLSRNDVTAYTTANPGYALILRADYRIATSPVVMIGAAEMQLAVAEAINIGWVTGTDLNTTYQNGIKLSFEQWGLDDPTPSYFNNAAVKLGAADGNVAANYGSANDKAIAYQQWLAAYPDGHMAWNIWRKTGWPALVPGSGAENSSKQIPRRIAYATYEFTTNPAGVKAAVAREVGLSPGTDSQDNRVFWDVGYKH